MPAIAATARPRAAAFRAEQRAQPLHEAGAAGEVGHGRGELRRSRHHGRRAGAPPPCLVIVDILGREPYGRGCRGEGGVGLEDALVQGGQVGAGLDAELLDERAPGVGEDRERLGLPAAAVVGQHQLGA